MCAYWRVVILVWLALISTLVNGATCSSLFPSGAVAHTNSGAITLQYQAKIYDSGTVLTTRNINDYSGGNSCNTASCTKSGSAGPSQDGTFVYGDNALGNITVGDNSSATKAAGSYMAVSVGQNSTLTFSTTGGVTDTKGWAVQNGATLNLAPGDYYITNDLNIYDNVTLNITGSGMVRLFVTSGIYIGSNFRTPTNVSSQLMIYLGGNMQTNGGGEIHAFIYSRNARVTLGNLGVLYGAISAADVELASQAKLYYQAAQAAILNVPGYCTGTGIPSSSVNNFLIDVGGGAGSNCAASSITITARDSSNATLSSYTGSINISTSTAHGTWATTGVSGDTYGTLTPGASDSGAATYAFNSSDAGTIVLSLTNTRAETLTITVNNGSGVSSTSANLSFSANAFVVSATDSLATDVVAGRNHAFRVTMMRQSPGGTSCSAATGYNLAGVKAWITRASSDPTGAAPNLINASATSVSLPNTKPGSNNVTLNFTSGVADFTLSTSDVGRYALNFADSSNSFAAAEITGSSSSFTVRPFGVYISATGNPAASTDSGTVFKRAGENFTVTVKAVAWQSADDANNDGQPDNHTDTNGSNNANLADNTALNRFGYETPAERISLAGSLRLPSGGYNPGLSDGDATAVDGRIISSFTAGSGSTTQVNFSDVGIIELEAIVTDGDYLSTGNTNTTKALSRSGFVGRFKPYQFSASSLSLTAFCSASTAFSYLGKTLAAGVTLAAQNQQGSTTLNYAGSYAKLTSAGYQLKARDTSSNTDLSSRMQLDSVSGTFSSGQINATLGLTLNRASTPDGPFSTTSVGLIISDTDSVSLKAANLNLDTNADATNESAQLGQHAFYYGRLRLDDAFGPETNALPITFITERWLGTYFTQNTYDSCSSISASAINYPAGNIATAANLTVPVGSGSSIGSYGDLSSGSVKFLAGSARHSFSAPGSGKTGSFQVDVNLTAYPWLQFDWNNDSNISNDSSLPTQTITFGSYRGHDRVILWQEQ